MQVKKQYSLGPWSVNQNDVLGVDGNRVCMVSDWQNHERHYPQLSSNLSIIAAAPDLVDALVDQIEETQNLLRLVNSIEFKPKPSVTELAECATDKALAALVKAGVITKTAPQGSAREAIKTNLASLSLAAPLVAKPNHRPAALFVNRH